MENDQKAQGRRRLRTPSHGSSLHPDEAPGCCRSGSRRRISARDVPSRSLHRSRSPHRSRRSQRSPSPQYSRTGRRSSPSVENNTSRRAELEREREAAQERLRSLENQLHQERSRQRDATATRDGTKVRDHSPTFSSKDVLNILNSIRNQPSAAGPPNHSSTVVNNHKNILPDFDPSSKNQRVDVWLRKVNECATVYGWDDKTTIHFSMQKLQGLAKTWYESLDSILFSWDQWQDKLSQAFPFEQNYGQSLEDMLRRRSKYNEPIEVYYYEKLALLNQCDIVGKRAVDCIIHGLSDRTMKSSALTLRCSQPDELLQFLMSNKELTNSFDRSNTNVKNRLGSGTATTDKTNKGNSSSDNVAFCFNCKERGHIYRKCPKPLIRCNQCHRVGHKVDKCHTKLEDSDSKIANTQKTMCISLANHNSKFYKDILVNGVSIKAFIDFGSEVCLLAESKSIDLMLRCDGVRTPIRGFGNVIVYSLGKVTVEINIDGVSANTVCQVVEDRLLDVPLLVGQTYTEQSHIFVLKSAKSLQFIDIIQEIPFSNTEIDEDRLVKVISAANFKIFGPIVIKAFTEPRLNGHIIINSKVLGKPTFQYVVCGGVYALKDGIVYVYVMPVLNHCHVYKGSILSRASNIQVVNSVFSVDNKLVTDRIDISKVHIGDNIDTTHKSKLLELLQKYKDCFASNLKELGSTNITEMNIEINSKRPIVYRPYRLSHKERDQVREMVGEMLEAGAYELETLAVICSLRKFRVYLLGQNFKIVTDCSALRSTFIKRDIIPRIARWYLLIQEFQCTIEYRPGNRMAHVDALSRNPIKSDGNNLDTMLDVTDQYPKVLVITGDDWLHTLQLGDSELSRIRDNYVIKDNKLYRCVEGDKTNLRWVVPKGARWQLCRMNHDDIGHFGVEKTLDRMRNAYWFPKMSKFVKKYVEACIECAYSKKTSCNEGHLHPIPEVEVPFHTVHVDHLGPFVRSKRGNSYILVMVDAFTKFVFIRPVRNTKSLVAIRVLDEIFCTFRVPDRIISDRGSCFTSHAFSRFCLDKGTKHVLNAVASPRSNGQVERYNRTILASLTAINLNDSEKDWDDKVGKIQWGINNTVNKTTGKMAAEVMFGNCMSSELDPRLNVVREETRENSNLVTIREEV